MPKREHLDEVIARIEAAIAKKRTRHQMPTQPKLITLDIRDVERLINASIWGDD